MPAPTKSDLPAVGATIGRPLLNFTSQYNSKLKIPHSELKNPRKAFLPFEGLPKKNYSSVP